MHSKPSANLDLLRAVAVLLVLAQHLSNRFSLASMAGFRLPPIGTFGVLLFFVHTCLVLMYSMERGGLDGPVLAGNFYVRRLFRIYPLSILAVLTAVALHMDSGAPGIQGLSRAEPVSLGRILSNLFLIQNLVKPGSIINVLWSLPVEVQMYVILPFLFLWIHGKKAPVWRLSLLWAVAVPVAIVHAHLAGASGPASLARRLSFLDYVPNFLPGIIAFALPREPKIRSYFWLPFILILIAVYSAVQTATIGWALCLVLGFAIPFFGEIKTGWLRWISHRIATYSYGIYLSHQFCIWVVADPLASFPLWSRVAVLLVGLTAIPIALYYIVERPMIKVGAELADKMSNRQLVPATAVPEVAQTAPESAA